jgi:hypothetical protein
MKSIYICKKPFEVLNAIVTKLNEDETPSSVIIDPWFPKKSAEHIEESLNRASIFEDCLLLESVHEENGSKKKYKDVLNICLRNSRRINKYIDNKIGSSYSGKLYTTDESKQTDQLLIKEICRRRNGKHIHIERGISDYIKYSYDWPKYPTLSDLIFPSLWTVRKEVHRLQLLAKCGFWWGPTRPEENDDVDHIIALYPQLIRSGYSNHSITNMPSPEKYISFLKRWIPEYLKEIDINRKILEVNSLLILPHFHSYNISERKKLNKLLNKCIKMMDSPVGVKPHPRSNNVPFETDDVRLIPKSVPVEVVYAMEGINITDVVGVNSTSFYTAKYLCNKVNVLSIANIVKKNGKKVDTKLSKINVGYPDSVEELTDYL